MNFSVEKDLEEILSQYFCHLCYAHLDRRTVVKATWLNHYDDNCSVCSCEEEIKKEGRPKKAKRGRRRQRTPTKPLYKTLKSLLKTYLLSASRSFPITFRFPII